jgi:hypothetical protein
MPDERTLKDTLRLSAAIMLGTGFALGAITAMVVFSIVQHVIE